MSHSILRQAFARIPLRLIAPIGVPGDEARGSLCCSNEVRPFEFYIVCLLKVEKFP